MSRRWLDVRKPTAGRVASQYAADVLKLASGVRYNVGRSVAWFNARLSHSVVPACRYNVLSQYSFILVYVGTQSYTGLLVVEAERRCYLWQSNRPSICYSNQLRIRLCHFQSESTDYLITDSMS